MPLETTSFEPKTPDPVWTAYRGAFPARENQVRTDAEMRRKRAQTSYDQGITDLERNVATTRSNTLASLEGRGVLRSGETQKRLADITARETEARARAAQALVDQKNAADAEQQRQLTAMYAEYEAQAAAAKEREWQQALQLWYSTIAANAGRAPQPIAPAPRMSYAPAKSGPPQPTLQQIADAMRPAPQAVPSWQQPYTPAQRAASSFVVGGRGPQ